VTGDRPREAPLGVLFDVTIPGEAVSRETHASKGSKPWKERGIGLLATAGGRRGLVRRSNASEPSRPLSRAAGQRQGGNGHGDVVRLSARFFEGYERRRGEAPGSSIAHASAGRRSGRGRKRGEPHGRQRDATSPRRPSGGSRRGGAKPRGRNVQRGWSPRCRSLPTRASGSGGGSGRSDVRRRRGAGVEAARAVATTYPREARPNASATVRSGQGRRCLPRRGSEDHGGPLHRLSQPVGSARPTDLEGPSGDGQGRGGSGKGQRPATVAPRGITPGVVGAGVQPALR
jgi:hypothetical protein